MIKESLIFLLKATQFLLVDIENALLKSTNVVVVLIPPPVDPGEAPININIISINNPPLVNPDTEYVLNPAVLADTLKKKAPSHVISSVNFNSSTPPSN